MMLFWICDSSKYFTCKIQKRGGIHQRAKPCLEPSTPMNSAITPNASQIKTANAE
jgi:hypothetical protein